jgi:hypothetical protein
MVTTGPQEGGQAAPVWCHPTGLVLLKHLIPMKTDHWDVTTRGYLEIDLVLQSGASAAGEFLHTLDNVDIQAG